MISLSELTIGELAAYIAEHLRSKGIETVLVGGACISIYSANEFSSFDLDFIITGMAGDRPARLQVESEKSAVPASFQVGQRVRHVCRSLTLMHPKSEGKLPISY